MAAERVMWFLLMTLLCMVVGGQGSSVSGRCQEDQQSMLLQLKKGFNFNTSLSQKLARWDSSIDCCRWPGIRCDPGGHVIGLDLSGEMIMGGLDDAMAMFNLQHLQVLDLSFNNFNTTVPTGIGNLTYLRYLNLSSAGFYGQIPAAISGLTKLVGLDLSMLYFPGAPIPETLGKFSALYVLNFSNNAFTGQIPTVLGNLSQLESLDLSNNELSGQIPQELARLTFLSALNLSNNHLAGSIPTGSQLQTFDNSSFGGNPGLCGIPLSRYCIPQPVSAVSLGKSGAGIQWTLLSIEFGGVFGLAAVILPAMLWPRFQNWYWPRIDSLIVRLFPRLYVKDRNRHLRQRRRRGRRSSR
ncbi:Receptor-like protein 50 [Linum perenne]